jgi:uncharacterized protein YbjT (DUF2867 family)
MKYLVWKKASAAVEIAQGKAVADAAIVAGVSLFIWSSLPNVTKMTGGKVTTVHHFDSKAEVEDYIRGLPFHSSVFFMPGWFMQNVWNPLAPKPKIVRFFLISVYDLYLRPILKLFFS